MKITFKENVCGDCGEPSHMVILPNGFEDKEDNTMEVCDFCGCVTDHLDNTLIPGNGGSKMKLDPRYQEEE